MARNHDTSFFSPDVRQTGLRVLCALLCIPSGGALLAKVYGIASMKAVTLFVMLPGLAILAALWLWAVKTGKTQLNRALTIGFLGGLVGTIAYDLARIPFTYTGQRIFAPISAYGVWILDSPISSRLTELVGWSYHFSNGITFGIMYALLTPRRNILYAIVWACMLETIAILSPFSRIFHLSGNYPAIAIAYFGHLAYGLPLGIMTKRLDDTWSLVNRYRQLTTATLLLSSAAAVLWPLTPTEHINRDLRAQSGEFRVEGTSLNPDWLRVERDEALKIYNPQNEAVSVHVKQTNQTIQAESGQTVPLEFSKPGIYQIFIETNQTTRSSFVIVEPVEAKE